MNYLWRLNNITICYFTEDKYEKDLIIMIIGHRLMSVKPAFNFNNFVKRKFDSFQKIAEMEDWRHKWD